MPIYKLCYAEADEIDTDSTMIFSLNVSPDQKELYLGALDILNREESQALFSNLLKFIERIELKDIENIKKDSFETVAWMRKKEIKEKMEEMNGFSFLLHNL